MGGSEISEVPGAPGQPEAQLYRLGRNLGFISGWAIFTLGLYLVLYLTHRKLPLVVIALAAGAIAVAGKMLKRIFGEREALTSKTQAHLQKNAKGAIGERLIGYYVHDYAQGLGAGFREFGSAVSTLVNTLLLAVVYILAVGPTSLIAKFAGKKFLQNAPEPENESYWEELELGTGKREEYYRQF